MVEGEKAVEEMKLIEERIIRTAESLSLTEKSMQHIKESVIRD